MASITPVIPLFDFEKLKKHVPILEEREKREKEIENKHSQDIADAIKNRQNHSFTDYFERKADANNIPLTFRAPNVEDRVLRPAKVQSHYRNVVWCLNNWTQADYDRICQIPHRYHVIGKEIGPKSGTPHLHGYLELEEQMRFKALKEALGQNVWFEARRGSAEQAADYAKKDGEFVESGQISQQGAKSCIADLKKRLEDGETPDDIILDDPYSFHMYGRTLMAMWEIMLKRRKPRTVQPEAIWIHGPTGAGKSHAAFTEITGTYYDVPDDDGWWDNYEGQDTVIFNDFRGDAMKFNLLLKMIDKWPFSVRRRNKAPMPFSSKKVIITCIMPPQTLYGGMGESGETLDQLLRRIKIVHMPKKYEPVVTECPQKAMLASGGITNEAKEPEAFNIIRMFQEANKRHRPNPTTEMQD